MDEELTCFESGVKNMTSSYLPSHYVTLADLIKKPGQIENLTISQYIKQTKERFNNDESDDTDVSDTRPDGRKVYQRRKRPKPSFSGDGDDHNFSKWKSKHRGRISKLSYLSRTSFTTDMTIPDYTTTSGVGSSFGGKNSLHEISQTRISSNDTKYDNICLKNETKEKTYKNKNVDNAPHSRVLFENGDKIRQFIQGRNAHSSKSNRNNKRKTTQKKEWEEIKNESNKLMPIKDVKELKKKKKVNVSEQNPELDLASKVNSNKMNGKQNTNSLVINESRAKDVTEPHSKSISSIRHNKQDGKNIKDALLEVTNQTFVRNDNVSKSVCSLNESSLDESYNAFKKKYSDNKSCEKYDNHIEIINVQKEQKHKNEWIEIMDTKCFNEKCTDSKEMTNKEKQCNHESGAYDVKNDSKTDNRNDKFNGEKEYKHKTSLTMSNEEELEKCNIPTVKHFHNPTLPVSVIQKDTKISNEKNSKNISIQNKGLPIHEFKKAKHVENIVFLFPSMKGNYTRIDEHVKYSLLESNIPENIPKYKAKEEKAGKIFLKNLEKCKDTLTTGKEEVAHKTSNYKPDVKKLILLFKKQLALENSQGEELIKMVKLCRTFNKNELYTPINMSLESKHLQESAPENETEDQYQESEKINGKCKMNVHEILQNVDSNETCSHNENRFSEKSKATTSHFTEIQQLSSVPNDDKICLEIVASKSENLKENDEREKLSSLQSSESSLSLQSSKSRTSGYESSSEQLEHGPQIAVISSKCRNNFTDVKGKRSFFDIQNCSENIDNIGKAISLPNISLTKNEISIYEKEENAENKLDDILKTNNSVVDYFQDVNCMQKNSDSVINELPNIHENHKKEELNLNNPEIVNGHNDQCAMEDVTEKAVKNIKGEANAKLDVVKSKSYIPANPVVQADIEIDNIVRKDGISNENDIQNCKPKSKQKFTDKLKSFNATREKNERKTDLVYNQMDLNKWKHDEKDEKKLVLKRPMTCNSEAAVDEMQQLQRKNFVRLRHSSMLDSNKKHEYVETNELKEICGVLCCGDGIFIGRDGLMYTTYQAAAKTTRQDYILRNLLKYRDDITSCGDINNKNIKTSNGQCHLQTKRFGTKHIHKIEKQRYPRSRKEKALNKIKEKLLLS